MSTNPPIPGVPQPTPQATAPQAPTAPAAPAAPSPVQYVAGDAMARAVVDGKPMDVRVSDLVRQYQIGSAAEQRLAQANRLADQHRGDLETVQRIRTLATSNPQAALEEARQRLGLPIPPKASDNPQGDPDQDPQTTRIMAELQALRTRVQEHDQFQASMVTQSVTQQIDAAVRELPLYAGDPVQAARASRFVAAYLQSNPTASIREIAGLVHADDVELVTRQIQQKHDQRAGNVQQLATIPAGSGSPALAQAPSAKMTEAEMRAPSSKGALMRILGEARKAAGS